MDKHNEGKKVKSLIEENQIRLNPVLSKSLLSPSNIGLSKTKDIVQDDESKKNEGKTATTQSDGIETNLSKIHEKISVCKIYTQDATIKEGLEQIKRMIAACNATIIDNNKRLKNLEHVFGASTSQDTTENDDNFIMQFFPLSTIQAIRDMEYMLTSTEEAVIHFRKFLWKIGGNNPKNNIQRILKNVFTNECVVDCSWKGKRDNFKICDLKLIKIMKRDVISRYVTLTEAEFENIVAEWLRFAKQRQERDKNKRNVELEEHYV